MNRFSTIYKTVFFTAIPCLCLLLCGGGVSAQTAAVTQGPTTVEVNLANAFTAQGIVPNGATITNYIWNVTNLGNGTINGVAGLTATVPDTDGANTIQIVWGPGIDNLSSNVTVSVRYVLNGATITSPASAPYQVNVNRICSPLIQLSGNLPAPTTVGRCCTDNISYEVTNVCFGNNFTWFIPNGWTLISGAGTSSITVKPDANTSGNVQCIVRRNQSVTGYFRDVIISITRPNPIVTKTGTFQQINICKGQSYTYKVNTICGATSYTWTFPAGWTFTGNGTQVTATATNTALSGNVTIAANLCSGNPVSTSYPLQVLNAAPPTPVFDIPDTDFDGSYHCDRWNVCPAGGSGIGVLEIPTATSYTFQVSSPWKVNGQTGPITIPYNYVTITGPSNAPGSGTLQVKALNCVGQSGWVSTTFYKENTYWCSNPYPVWCECCEPPCNGCPPYQLRTTSDPSHSPFSHLWDISGVRIFPNPGKGIFYVELETEYENSQMQVFDMKGKVLATYGGVPGLQTIDISHLPEGTYFLSVTGTQGTITRKLLLIPSTNLKNP